MKKLKKINAQQKQLLASQAATVLHFTGHMYGIGALALNQSACERINRLKQRSEKEFIVLLADISWLKRYGLCFKPSYAKVTEQFWPGNVTMIVKDTQSIFSHISLDGKLAVRIPDDPALREFLKDLDQPIVSTSINISGEPPLNNLKTIKAYNWCDYAFLPKHVPKQIEDAEPSTIIDLTLNQLKIIRAGRFDLSDFTRAIQAPKILFVCTANICRSPMAEYIARQFVEKESLPYRIGSAGFLPGDVMISENSYLVLKEHGYAAEEHLSTQLNKELVDDCWLILTMTTEHKERLKKMDQNIENKLFTLSEFTGYQLDIEDPYGLEISFYRQTFLAIEKRVQEMFIVLRKNKNPIREGA